MTDFHSHILPGIDDGSRSVEESTAMLYALSAQNIKTVFATPHFYASDESLSSFLSRREKAFESLREAVTADMPRILLGAEVRFYEGISRMEGLKSLCAEGTDLLLLEMPMCKWSEYAIKELIDISCSGKVTLVLAHIERYMKLQRNGVFQTLLRNGVLMQINASALNGLFSRRKALSLLKMQAVHFIGSDCHNMKDRAPKIGSAYATIHKKLGEDFLNEFINMANNFSDKNIFSKG